jgi:eukaryotic-like serine/threonine-protein kinase
MREVLPVKGRGRRGDRPGAERSRIAPPPRRVGLSSEDADPIALLQSRLRLLHLILFGLAASLLIASASVNLLRGREVDDAMRVTYLLHGSIVVAAGGTWLLLGARRIGPFALQVLDAVSLLAIGIMASGMVAMADVRYRPELSVLLGMAHVLVGRAALVPSTALRTTMVGLVTLQPLAIATYYAQRQPTTPEWLQPAGASLVMTIVWSLLIVGLSVVTSHIIYGLRRKVEKAMQLGQYTVERLIGKGGMGAVYLARHSLLRRPTALKVLESDAAGVEAIARFEREVQTTSQLNHPNTVAIYDYGRTPDACFYYAMEYVDGFDLESLVAADGPQPPGRVAYILGQVCGALAEAHGKGLVHRDIKPANIMLCQRGFQPDFVKVLDFGLVRSQAAAAPELSAEHAVRGTPLYMAPECVLSGRDVDARSDIYAVGAVAYFLLVGKPPFEGDSAIEVMARQVREAPVPPGLRSGRALPRALEALIMGCLEKEPDMRPSSMTALREAIEQLDCGPWSEADARRWWQERAHHVREAQASREEPGSAPTTVVVDMAERHVAIDSAHVRA